MQSSMTKERKASLAQAIVACVCAVVLALGTMLPTTPALADDETDGDESTGSITLSGTTSGDSYSVWQLFDGSFTTDDDGYAVMDDGTVNSSYEEAIVKALFDENSSDEDYSIEGYTVATGDDGSYTVSTDESSTEADRTSALISAISGLSSLQSFADTLAGYLSDLEATQTATAESDSLEFSDLDAGYYLITTEPADDSGIEGVSLLVVEAGENSASAGTATPEAVIQVAEEDAEGTLSWGDMADAQVGEAVSYRVEGSLSGDFDDFDTYHYEFDITPSSSLSIDMDSVAVTLLDADGNEVSDLTSEASISFDGEDGFLSVTFDDLKASASEATEDSTVLVTYEASLSAAAGTGTDGVATTTAYVYYNSDPDSSGSTASSATDTASLFTWGVNISKIGADTDMAIYGATFTIQNADGQYVSADGTLSDEAVEVECGDYSSVEVTGLDAGDYTISEVVVPDGYEAVDFTLTISASYGDSVKLSASVDSSSVAIESVDAASGIISVEVTDPVPGSSDASDSDATADDADADEYSADDASTSYSADGSGDDSDSYSALSDTGDILGRVIAALAIVAVVAGLVAVAVRRRKLGEADETL